MCLDARSGVVAREARTAMFENVENPWLSGLALAAKNK